MKLMILVAGLVLVLTGCSGGGGAGTPAPSGGTQSPSVVVISFTGSSSFNNPSGVAVDSIGNLYVADAFNHVIRKVTPACVVSTYAGTGSPGSLDGAASSAHFFYPQAVAVDALGNVYVADTNNNKIRKITPGAGGVGGVVSSYTGTANTAPGRGAEDGAAAGATFNGPSGVAVDASGNVYVADTYNNKIRMITSAGVVSSYTGTANTRMTPGYWESSSPIGASSATFNGPSGIALDASGNLYVADSGNNMIRMITPGTGGVGGTVSTYAGIIGVYGGAQDGAASSASFNQPSGVAVDASGNLYVADTGNNKIRMITPGTGGVGGTASSYTGMANFRMNIGATDGTAGSATFNCPSGIALDASGNLYVADANNNKIRKITRIL